MNTPDRNSQPATIKTVLVLDGDVLVRMPVVQFLRDCGHRVVEAASTDEAMAIFQKTNFPVDVVLSEIDIPGSMNGFGFAQWARSVRPELKILLAGTPERTVRNAAELCEIGPTLKRPYDHKLVRDRMKRLLAARAQQGRRCPQQRSYAPSAPCGPWASLRDFKLLPRSQDASGSAMSDAPRPPPPLPQNALIWIVVAALVLVLVRAVWRGWL
jgi:response regulator RpfG family c-di-GMP phosphodiesterase